MTASASAIKDALVTNLSAASVFGSEQVSTNYAVMESTSACCCIVDFTSYEDGALSFGNNRIASWTFLLEARLKDTGDPVTLMNNKFALTDKVIATLKSDDQLQDTAKEITAIRAARTPGEMEVVGGAAWLPVNFEVDIRVWDD